VRQQVAKRRVVGRLQARRRVNLAREEHAREGSAGGRAPGIRRIDVAVDVGWLEGHPVEWLEVQAELIVELASQPDARGL
jgi:hypothetical protein